MLIPFMSQQKHQQKQQQQQHQQPASQEQQEQHQQQQTQQQQQPSFLMEAKCKFYNGLLTFTFPRLPSSSSLTPSPLPLPSFSSELSVEGELVVMAGGGIREVLESKMYGKGILISHPGMDNILLCNDKSKHSNEEAQSNSSKSNEGAYRRLRQHFCLSNWLILFPVTCSSYDRFAQLYKQLPPSSTNSTNITKHEQPQSLASNSTVP